MIPILLSLPLLVQSVAVAGTKFPVTLETQVGRPFDTRVVDRDIQRLWSTSRFDDIRVEATADGAVIFRVVEAREARLHQIRLEPLTAGLQLKVPEGATISRLRAHEVALEARRQLNASGYLDARVDYELIPFGANEVDLQLNIDKGKTERVRNIEFTDGEFVDAKELRRALDALRTRRIVFWPLYPSYSPEAADADASRVRSVYLDKGYLDAKVTVDHPEAGRVAFVVETGPLFAGAPRGREMCGALLRERREAEREGIIDFSATLEPDMTVRKERGVSYRVGRIEFRGNHHVSDATLRRNFLLDEGDLLDEHLLRKSVERLNRMQLFEPVHVSDIVMRPDERTGIADLGIRLTERKRGAWGISGPVGPASFAGPLQASISSRLPPWGRGLFELSTYSVSLSLLAFAHPILPAWTIASKYPLLPVLALHRPFLPASGWLSGWAFAPQLGWRASVLSYATVQVQQRTLPRLAGDRGLEPELVVEVIRSGGDAPLFCEAPQPRLAKVRRVTSLAVQFMGAFTAF